MRKTTQDSAELLRSLSILETDWKDDFATRVIDLLERIPDNQQIEEEELIRLLDVDFEVASTNIHENDERNFYRRSDFFAERTKYQ